MILLRVVQPFSGDLEMAGPCLSLPVLLIINPNTYRFHDLVDSRDKENLIDFEEAKTLNLLQLQLVTLKNHRESTSFFTFISLNTPLIHRHPWRLKHSPTLIGQVTKSPAGVYSV